IVCGRLVCGIFFYFFFFSSRRRHTRLQGDWSSDVCSSDLFAAAAGAQEDCPAAQIVKIRGALEPPPPPPLHDVMQPAGGGDGGLKTVTLAVALVEPAFANVFPITVA